MSTGDLFREALNNNSAAGKEIRSFMEDGLLVPDNLVMRIIMDLLNTLPGDAQILMDGFPRTVTQAHEFETVLRDVDLQLSRVVLLDVEREVLERRLVGRLVCCSCGEIFHRDTKPPQKEGLCDVCGGGLEQRADDRIETIRKRQDVFEELTLPLVEFYEGKKLLARVNGQRPQDEVLHSLIDLLG